jgi:hypothetical protein
VTSYKIQVKLAQRKAIPFPGDVSPAHEQVNDDKSLGNKKKGEGGKK